MDRLGSSYPQARSRAALALRIGFLLVVLSSTFVVLPTVRSDAVPIPETSTTTVFDAGAYIIDMGVEPQTIDNTLKAYGLIYSLMIENLIPVEWVISDAKTGDTLGPSDDPDLVYDGQEFKGGPFVIRAEYAELAEPIFADPEWAGLNIVGPTTEEVVAPVFKTLTNWPNAVLDDANGKFGQGYFEDAGIPQFSISAATGGEKVAYEFKDPQTLDSCDDIYVMPHADPEWATHSNLVPWNAEGGYIWAGCHAVSVMEQAANPGDLNPDPDMNFLSTNGLIDFGAHDDGTTPYSYTTDVSDPIMQFVGTIDAAQQNGSEQIYLPADGSAWRPTTNVLVYDADHPDLASSGGTSPGEAASLVYGRGFGDPDAGLVMYEGGHSIDTGNESGVAAIRAYMNLHLLAGIERGLEVDANVPAEILAGSTVDVSAVVEGGDPDYEYTWVSTCGGTFSPATGVAGPGELIESQFTAPAGATDCQISIDINDFCGRGGFDKVPVEIVEEADLTIAKTDDTSSVSAGGDLTYTLTVTNAGPNDATGVTVVDTWPAAKVAFVEARPSQGTCSYSAGTLTCELGDIPVGGSATIEVDGTVRSGATGEILNSATVDSNELDPDPGDNTDTDTTLVSGLQLDKTADPGTIDLVSTGGAPVDVTFTFEVSNLGPGDLSDVTVTDPDLPACTPVYQSGDTNGDDVLQVGEVWVFTCVAPVDATSSPENIDDNGDFVNTATATGVTDTGDVVDATDSAVVDLVAPGIDIQKGADGQTVTDGGSVSFDITVTNTGDTVLEDVTVSDPDAPGCDRYLGDLDPGETITYQCALSPASVSGTNTASVEGLIPDGGGQTVTDTDDADYTVVDGDLDITKVPVHCATGEELTDPAYYPGDTVCYRVVVTNTGDTTQTNVELTDDLPTGLDHVETTVTAPVTLIDDGFDRDVTDDNVYDAGWTEYADNEQARDGDVNIRADGDCPEGAQCLYVKDDEGGIQWDVDLTAASSVDAAYQYTVIRNNEPGRFFVGCWDGTGWVELDAVTYANQDTLPTPAGPSVVDVTDLALPAACQIAAGAIGLVVPVDSGDGVNSDNEVLFDTLTFVTDTGASISDDFENFRATDYYSTGLTPGWAEYNDNDPAERDNGDVRSANEADPSQDCDTPEGCAVAVRKKDKGLVWPADYSTYDECAITFDYLVYNTDKDPGLGFLNIGGVDAGGTWVTVDSILMDTVGDPLAPWPTETVVYDAADLAGLTALGVSTDAGNNDNDRFAVDNVLIACVDVFTTTAHPVIVDASDGIDLAPGQQIVADIETVVTDEGGAFPRELVNVASTSSSEQLEPSRDTAEIERVAPAISLDKTVDPTIVAVGDTVTYTFVVSNTGNEPLESVTVSDPALPDCTPVLVEGDLNGNDILNPNEDWVFTCDVVIEASLINDPPTFFDNVATVEGDPLTPGSGDVVVTDTDDASVDVVAGGIDIVKSVDKTIIRPGEPVTYTYEVTLADGTTEPLTEVSVLDDKCAPVSGPTAGDDGDGVLEPGETWLFTCSTTLLETTTNVAQATGTDRADVVHTETDDAVVDVIDPDIALVKTAAPTEVSPGDPVTYTFEVTNPGNDPLSDVILTDDTCSPVTFTGGDTSGDGLLDPGETWTYVCTTEVFEDTTNIAEVGGTDSLGKIWTDADTADVNVVVPSIVVEKFADTSLVYPGEEVTYEVWVYNDGDFPFDTVTLDDDNCSPLAFDGGDTNDNGLLDPGERWDYLCTTTLDVTTTNTVTVDVTGPDGDATDTDNDRVRVADPVLEITKVPSETLVPPGTEVTYTYTVTNATECGLLDINCRQDSEISDVVVTDDKCSPVTYVSGDVNEPDLLSVGETWTFQCTAVLEETTTNTATVTGTNPDGRPIPDPPTIDATVDVAAPELVLDKAAPELTVDADGSGDLSAGDVLTYTITGTVIGAGELTDVVISDDLITPSSVTCAVVPVGETCVLQGTYTVTEADVAAGEIVNVATGDSNETDPTTDTETVDVPQPGLSVVKSDADLTTDADGSQDVSAGDTLTYTVTVTNTGETTLTGVVVSDPLLTPSSVTCATLEIGQTCVLEGTYVVTAEDVTAGEIVNTGTGDSDQTDPDTDQVITEVPTPALETVKVPPALSIDADGSNDISAGDTLTYTVTVTNTGTANLTDVVVTDDLIDPSTVTCELVLPGDTCVLTGTYVVTAEDVTAGEIVNAATGDADQTDPDTGGITTTVPTPALEVDKAAPTLTTDADGSADISVGDTITYTVTATNTGDANLTNVVVEDLLLTPSSQTCSVLAPGATCVLEGTYVVTQADLNSSRIINVATGVSDQTDTEFGSEVTPLPRPRVRIDKPAPALTDADGSGDISAGDTLTYTITLTNSGTANLTDVVVSDDLITPSNITCELLEPGDTCVLEGTYVVTDADVVAGQVVNTATGDTDQTGEVTDGNTELLPFPLLVIEKSDPTNDDADDSGDVSAGDTLTYTITVTNAGTANLTGVTISDPLLDPDFVDCGTLAPGDTCQLIGDYTVDADDVTAGSIPNTATADADQTDPETGEVITPVLEPQLVIDKPAPANDDADGSGDVSVGDTLTYTITATNVGEATLTDVVVTDTRVAPSSVTCATVPAGGTCVLVGTYEVTQADVDRGVILNVAGTDSDQTGPDIDGEIVLVPRPQLRTEKALTANADEDGSQDVSVGDTLTYTVTVTNTGTANLTNVTVTDDRIDPGSTTCTTLAPGESCVLVGTYVVTAADVDAGSIVNTATGDSDQTDGSTDSITTPVPLPLVQVDKQPPTNADEDGSGDVSAGDTLTYRITVTNVGEANLTDVVITDDLITPSTTTCDLIRPGETCTLEGTYVVTQADVDAGQVANTATGETDQTDPGTDEIVTPVPTPGLDVVKTGPSNADEDGSGDVSVGDTLTYTVTVTNTGDATLTDVVVTDDLIDPDTAICPEVAPGDTCVLEGTYTVTLADVDAGTIVNTATGDSDQTDPGTDEIVTPVPTPSLDVVKVGPALTGDLDGSGDISTGDELTYVVTVTNTGTATLTDVVVTDDLIDPGSTTCATLAPGATCVLTGTYTVTQADVDAGSITNVATGDSDQTDPGTDEIITGLDTPALVTDKAPPVLTTDADGSGDISAGDTLTYTVTVTNTGTANLTSVTVEDLALTPSSATCELLEPGETCVLTGTYTVDQGDINNRTIINIASGDSDQTGPDGDTEITPLPRPLLTIDKAPAVLTGDADGSGDISVGDTLTYTITATNAGTANLTDVVVTDPLLTPDTVTCELVAPGETCVLEGTYVVTADDVDAGTIVNSAAGDSGQTGEVTDQVVTPVPTPRLDVDKALTSNADEDGSGDISAGDTLTYTVTATNTGSATLTDVVVSDKKLSPPAILCPAVAPGETCVLVGTYVVTQADVDAGTIVNAAGGESDQTDGGTDEIVTPLPTPSLVVDKAAPTLTDDADGSGDISVGDTLTYVVTATNDGSANLTDVVVSDPLLTPDSATCALLAPGETCVLEGTYVVTQADLNSGRVLNVASGDSDQTDRDFDAEITPLQRPRMTIEKGAPTNADEDGSGDVSVGDTLTYTITVTNTGRANLTNVTITDDRITQTGGTSPCALLEPGDTCTLIGTYTVTEADVTAGQIVNTATGSSDQTVDVTDSVTEPVPFPLLVLDKQPAVLFDDVDGSGDISSGDVLRYTITATNEGTANLTNVVVNDPRLTPDTETCLTLAPGETCVLVGDYVVQDSDIPAEGVLLPGLILNTATGTSDQTDPTTDTVITPVEDPGMTLDKAVTSNDDADGSGDLSVGDTLTYTITATNTGDTNLTDVVVTDSLITPSTITCELLEPAETCVLVGTYQVTQADLAAGVIVNTATGESTQTGELIDDETVVLPRPQISINKPAPANDDADGSGDVSVGDTLTYTITVTNTGTANLTDVDVTDDTIAPTGGTTPCALLEPGDTCTLTGTYTVTATDIANGSIPNTATGSSDQTGDVTDSNVVEVPFPQLVIEKPAPANDDADGSGDVSVGDTLTYTVTVTNTGTANLTNVTVVDDTIVPTGGTTPCALLEPGDTCTLEGTYLVTEADVVAGEIANVASGGSDQTGPSTDEVVVPVPRPALAVTKSDPTLLDDADGSTDISAGDTLEYTITVTNTGTANLTDVVVTDDTITPTGGTTPCALLEPGDTCTLIGTYLVTTDDVDAGEIVNVATGESVQTDPGTDQVITPVPTPLLIVDKAPPVVTDDADGSGDISAGDELTYTVTATNAGDAVLTDVVVSDPLLNPDEIICPRLEPGESCVLVGTYIVQTSDATAGSLPNTATGDSDQTDPDTDGITTPVPTPDLQLVKADPVNADEDGSGDVSVGDTLTYTITVTNTGTANLTDVTITDDLIDPDSVTCGLVEPGGTCVLEGTYVVTAADVDAGEIANTATGSSDQTEPETGGVVTEVPTPRQLLVKSQPTNDDADGSGDISAGDTLTYTIRLINLGSANLTDVTITDTLIDPSSITCELVAPVQSCVLTGTYTVTQEDVDAGEVANVATGGSDQTDGGTDEIVTPLPTPGLDVVKTGPVNADEDGSGDVTLGDTLTYTVTATNVGTANLTNVVVSDPLLTPDEVVCALLAPGETCVLTGTYTVTQADVDLGELLNTATADSDQTDGITGEVLIPIPAPALTLDKAPPELTDDADGSGDVSVGDTLTYTITATNVGEANLADVVVTDDLIDPSSVTCELVAPGETCVLIGTYVVAETDLAAGMVDNVATASGNGTDEITDSITIDVPQPQLELSKPPPALTGDADASGDITVGDTLTFTITATNVGTANLVGVTITDEMIDPSSVDCPLLEPGDTCVLEGTYVVTAADAERGTILNAASAGNDWTEVLDEVLVDVVEPLPATGADAVPVGRLALALLVAGGTLLLLAGRREPHARPGQDVTRGAGDSS